MIYAIDFDGTFCMNAWPEIGAEKKETTAFVRKIQERGDKWILLTMREGDKLDAAVAQLQRWGLFPDAVNDNLPERIAQWGNNPRKIYADTYIDDHNAGGLLLPE